MDKGTCLIHHNKWPTPTALEMIRAQDSKHCSTFLAVEHTAIIKYRYSEMSVGHRPVVVIKRLLFNRDVNLGHLYHTKVAIGGYHNHLGGCFTE